MGISYIGVRPPHPQGEPSGGSDKTTFYVAGQYLDQKGIIVHNALKRYSGRVNLDNKVNNWFR